LQNNYGKFLKKNNHSDGLSLATKEMILFCFNIEGGVKWSYACITYLTTILICPFLIALIDYYNLHILDPLFLVCTFLHEFSHALATWATCGKVSSNIIY
jgi:hypothetical protein